MILRWSAILAVTAMLPACRPWDRDGGLSAGEYPTGGGDYYAGPVDPAPFQPAYQGDDFVAGEAFGTITAKEGAALGEPVEVFIFPAAASHATLKTDQPATADRPIAYLFDGCQAPPDYRFDQWRDFVRFDEQGVIFTVLPTAATYRPVVAEVPVVSGGLPCQAAKSHEEVVVRTDVTFPTGTTPAAATAPPPARPTGNRSGRYFAQAIVDPSADVRLSTGVDPATGLGPQRWGFFNHYLVAYIDGGEIPTLTRAPGTMNCAGAPNANANLVCAVTQDLFVASTDVDPDTGELAYAQRLVVTAKRGQPGYSPLCRVLVYTPVDPMNLPTSHLQIPAGAMPSGDYVYCLQAQAQ